MPRMGDEPQISQMTRMGFVGLGPAVFSMRLGGNVMKMKMKWFIALERRGIHGC
jgi:hypothetical protein